MQKTAIECMCSYLIIMRLTSLLGLDQSGKRILSAIPEAPQNALFSAIPLIFPINKYSPKF